MISEKMKGFVANSSAIRAMFEEGKKLAARYGADHVYDFSLGNPNVPAPAAVKDAVNEHGTAVIPIKYCVMTADHVPVIRFKSDDAGQRRAGFRKNLQHPDPVCNFRHRFYSGFFITKIIGDIPLDLPQILHRQRGDPDFSHCQSPIPAPPARD